jgi:two-component sensor histidine kinase
VVVKLQSGVGFGEGRLTVTDNGRGIRTDAPVGAGPQLIDSLSRQIGGQLKRENSPNGTSTVVTFPIID